jgi:hypothetical protein
MVAQFLEPSAIVRAIAIFGARPRGLTEQSAPQHIEVYDILRLTAKAIQDRGGID